MPCAECGNQKCFPYTVKEGSCTPVAIVCDLTTCKNYVPAGGVVCYLPNNPTNELVKLDIVGDDWVIVDPTTATMVYTAPDGTQVNYTVTRIAGTGTLVPGTDLFGRKTVTVNAVDTNPTTWQLSWDNPSQGPVSVAFGDIDSLLGETVDNWSTTPDNIGIIENIDDWQGVLTWDTSLKAPVNSVQFDFTGAVAGQSMRFGPFQMWFDQETFRIREAFVTWINDPDCLEPPELELRDTLTNELIDGVPVQCDIGPATWSMCLKDADGTQFQRVFHKESGVITHQDHDWNGNAYIPVYPVGPCDCEEQMGEICYQFPETLVTINESNWNVLSTTLATLTAPLGDTGSDITFTIQRLSGDGEAATPVGCSPPTTDTNMGIIQTVNSQWKISWNRNIEGPFTLSIYDVDIGENVTVIGSYQPDSTTNLPGVGSGLWSTMTWNTAEDLDGSVTLEFTPSCYGFAINTTFTVPPEVREAFVFIDCTGSRKFFDKITNEQITDSDIVKCADNSVTQVQILCDQTCTSFIRVYHKDPTTNIVTTQDHTLEGADYTPVDPVDTCEDSPPPTISLAYIQECQRFDNELPINSTATFSGGNTITFNSVNVAALVRSEIERAQSLEADLIKHGQAAVTFRIVTGAGTYSFYPSGLVDIVSSDVIAIDAGSVVSWPSNSIQTITTILYSTLDSCECRAVEAIQITDCAGEIIYLADVVDLENYDPTTGIKPSILDQDGLLPLYTLGPFPGACPSDLQVIEIDKLCCNDDLVTGSPDIANTRRAWLDAADNLSNLLDSIGGVPIAGNDGDVVGQVLDKLGGANTFDDGGGPNGGPYYKLNRLNELPGLQFLGSGGASGVSPRLICHVLS